MFAVPAFRCTYEKTICKYPDRFPDSVQHGTAVLSRLFDWFLCAVSILRFVGYGGWKHRKKNECSHCVRFHAGYGCRSCLYGGICSEVPSGDPACGLAVGMDLHDRNHKSLHVFAGICDPAYHGVPALRCE